VIRYKTTYSKSCFSFSTSQDYFLCFCC